MSYLVSGNNPAAIKTAERNIFTATAGQTTFTISQGYQPGDIDVFLNGVRLIDSDDYNATNGSTVVLTSGAAVGDSLAVVCYRPYQVTDFYTKSEQDTRYVNASGDTMSGVHRYNSYLSIGKGPSNNDQITWNAIPDNAGNYTPQWTGNATAGGTIMGIPSGGNGGLEIRTLKFGTNATPQAQSAYPIALSIDDVGRVSIPNQPSFYAYHSTSATPSNSSLFVFDSTNYNSGMYSTSTGRMTAPIAGRYFVTACFRVNSQNAGYYAQMFLYINGAVTYQGSYHGTTMSSGAAGYNSVIYTGILSLNQNDYVQPYWTVQAGTTNFSGTESWFSGHLLG